MGIPDYAVPLLWYGLVSVLRQPVFHLPVRQLHDHLQVSPKRFGDGLLLEGPDHIVNLRPVGAPAAKVGMLTIISQPLLDER